MHARKNLAKTTSVRGEGKTDSLVYTFQFLINKFSGRPGDDVPERIASFQLPDHGYAPHTPPPPFMKTPKAAVSVSVSENRAQKLLKQQEEDKEEEGEEL